MAQEILVNISINSSEAQNKLKGVSKSTGDYKQKVDDLTKAQNALKKAINPVNKEIQLTKLKIKEANAAAIEAAKVTRDLENGFIQEKTATELLSGSLDKLTSKQKLNLIESRKQELQLKLNKQQIDLEARAALGDAEALRILELQKKKVSGATGQMRAQSGLNNAILLETGRLASDASFGFTAIANNLSQVISLMQSYARTAGGFGNSLRELGKSILGTGGILIGVQLLISFLPKIIKSFNKTADSVKRFNEEVKAATESVEKQIEQFNRLNENVEKYGDVGKFAGDSIEKLRDQFSEFDTALKKFDEGDGTLITERFGEEEILSGANAISRLKKAFIELLTARKEESSLETQLFARDKKTGEFVIKSGEARRALQTKLSFALERRIRLEKELKQERADFSGIDVDLDIDEDKKLSLKDLFKDPEEDKEFQDMLNDIPEYIDNAEEVAENYARGKAKESLLSKILKISPASRENDLKKLKDGLAKFGSTTIEATQEYKDAIQAVNDKWDAIELKSKLDHYKNIASATAGFFSEMSRLNDQNKDLARASIIANSAAASIGIWQSYFDPKTPEKGTLALIASGIAQAGLIASTANALNSLNSDSALSSSSVNATQVQAPAFNVVGASPLDLLMVDISNKLEKPIPAYITAKGAISTLDEYYRNVRTGSNS